MFFFSSRAKEYFLYIREPVFVKERDDDDSNISR